MSIWNEIKSFFKVGAIGFGGGTALIPIIEHEVVEKKNYISKDDFAKGLVVQGITPGAFPIKIAGEMGLRYGALGAILLPYSTIFVGAFLALALTAVISIMSADALSWVEYVSVGVSSFVVLVLIKFIIRAPRSAKADKVLGFALALMMFAVVFTCSSKIEKIVELFVGHDVELGMIELNTSVVLLLGLNFVFVTKLKTKLSLEMIVRYIIAFALTIIGILTLSIKPIITAPWLKIVEFCLLGLSFAYAIVEEIVRARHNKQASAVATKLTTPLIAIFVSLAPLIVFGLLTGLLSKMSATQFFGNIWRSILSVVTTFGGGTAYISVAEGFFVGDGIISSEVFWSQIVPVGTALPGALLVKMLGAIWYNISFMAGGGMALNLCAGVFGVVLGTTATLVSFFVVYILYSCVKDLQIFEQIRKTIVPLISGLLLPTIISILANMLSISLSTGMNIGFSTVFVAVLVASCAVLGLVFKTKDIVLILSFAGISTLTLGLIANFI